MACRKAIHKVLEIFPPDAVMAETEESGPFVR
jgi:hypothetical protein